jgi:methylmalonyl-CoA mutase N-terminal domain/subunit
MNRSSLYWLLLGAVPILLIIGLQPGRILGQKPAAMHLRTHTNTSCFELVKQQPLNNIIRSAYHALGAALSGTTAMQIPAYDEPIGIPTEESAILTVELERPIYHVSNLLAII